MDARGHGAGRSGQATGRGIRVIDGTELEDGKPYTYFAIATYAADGFQNGIDSDPSTLGTITAINAPAGRGAGRATPPPEDTPLTVAAPGVLGNDGDEDSPVTLQASLVSGPAHGTLVLNVDGSFTYTPAANFNGVDGFTYRPAAAAVSSAR